MLDLDSIGGTVEDADNGSDLHLRHPATGELLYHDEEKSEPVTIRLAGHDGTKFQAAMRKMNSRRAKRGRREPTPEEVQDDNIELAVDMTLGWNIARAGEKLAFTPANARTIYQSIPWIRDQAAGHILSRENFLKASTKN